MPARMTRRGVLQGLAAATAGAAAAQVPEVARAQDTAPAPVVSRGKTKVIVLGSLGGQQMTQEVGAPLRCGTSVLIDVGGDLTVLDCGCGSVHRVVEAGYDLSRVRRILITHCHFDHVAELGSMVHYAWTSGRNGANANRRLDVYGPTGIGDYRRHFAPGIRRSIADQEGPLGQTPTFAKFARWHEFAPPKRSEGIVATDDVEVRAIRVQHGGIPSVGYRVKTPDVDLAFSGDRGATGDRFPSFAKGADVLFHEIIHKDIVLARFKGQKVSKTFIQHLVYDHCDGPTVGRTATTAGVGTLVLYHLIPGTPLLDDDAWRAIVAPHYGGRIIVSKDLQVV
jgi:ribonuclease BN (tRNA processing enzyme)